MTDVTASSMPAASVHKTDQAHRRLRRRYRAELGLKLAGALAILLATSALISLLWTVFGNAYGSIQKTYIKLPVNLDRGVLELPDSELDTDKIRGGNYTGAVRASLREAIPNVKGRTARRALYKLTSDGAALSLRQQALEDPTLIGTTQSVELLASDDVDLWVKGYVDKIEQLPVSGQAKPEVINDKVRVTVESNSFQPIVTTIKKALGETAKRIRAQAAAEMRGVRVFERRLANASLEVEK
ncbi:MAG: DUF3333 domain-containing protein, partial [Pseudomonadota bacterium]